VGTFFPADETLASHSASTPGGFSVEQAHLQKLFVDCLREMYGHEENSQWIEQHLEASKGPVDRLEKVFELLETAAKGKQRH
jgi:hypothetical protein